MKIVAAIDSFKGSMSSLEVADAFELGARKVFSNLEVVKLSLADGGEGTVESLVDGGNGDIITLKVKNPLMREIESFYGIIKNKNLAVIEMAAASGLPLLSKEERNPMKTSTFGTGELIKDALKKGCREFIVGIGGSATNDGGIGMLSALGYKFLDKSGKILDPIGENLINIETIDTSDVMPELKESSFLVACDVDNPLYGERGAAEVYSRQKGATEEMVTQLDNGLKHFSEIVMKQFNIEIGNYPGAGAAGGLGGGFLGFLNAQLKPGIDIIIETIGLEEQIKDADLVITGEGRIDFQSIMGKTPVGVAKLGKKYNIPVIAIAGCLADNADIVHDHGIDAIFSIINHPLELEDALKKENALKFVEKNAEQIMRLIKLSSKII
ncbi:MAG: glycerate kinase [Fusobacteriaceae bacterium]|nr:glycerate kinase [Fusobacteriaceae bacterium]MBP9510004.1 glycerate kinase [Fusobacteriaceae bacterium]